MRQALYRSYRPRNFDEVVGQEHITTVLKNEMAKGTPSHAYLFVGSRGTGKTSCAKLVAKAVNCLDLQDGNPCGRCAVCRGVDDASLLDVVEIDAASNNGVDNIRDLRDEAMFTPAVAKYRVYIIDEVHMLSASAFNALLKILEEPPEHVIFVLATTEIHKVLSTIISRCQRFDFRRIESGVIAARLTQVSVKEGFSLDADAAALIARLSEGGMRDALSLLDVCAAVQENITVQTVSGAAGLAGAQHLLELTDLIFDGNTAGVLEKFAALVSQSLEPQRLCEQLIGHFRNLMLVKTMQKPEDLLNCLPSEVDALRQQSKKSSLSELLHSMTVLQDAAVRMGRSAIKRAELELALVSLSEPSVRTGQQALLLRIERLEAAMRRDAVVSASPPACEPTGPKPQELRPAAQKETAPAAKPQQQFPTASAAAVVLEDSSEPFSLWPQVLEQLESVNGSVAALMRNTKAFFDGRRVLIDVQNPILLEMLKNNDYTRSCIKTAVAAVTGRNLGIGPYRPPEADSGDKGDPLEHLIASLPASDNITVE